MPDLRRSYLAAAWNQTWRRALSVTGNQFYHLRFWTSCGHWQLTAFGSSKLSKTPADRQPRGVAAARGCKPQVGVKILDGLFA